LSARRLAVLLGLAFAWQVTLSTEVLFMLTLALLVSLAGTAVLVPDLRLRLRRSIAPLAFAYALTAILVAPFTYYLATSSERTPNPGAQTFNGDLLNFVVPTRASLGGWCGSALAAHFPRNDIQRGAYLGVPTLVLLAWSWLAQRRRSAARLLLVLFDTGVLDT